MVRNVTLQQSRHRPVSIISRARNRGSACAAPRLCRRPAPGLSIRTPQTRAGQRRSPAAVPLQACRFARPKPGLGMRSPTAVQASRSRPVDSHARNQGSAAPQPVSSPARGRSYRTPETRARPRRRQRSAQTCEQTAGTAAAAAPRPQTSCAPTRRSQKPAGDRCAVRTTRKTTRPRWG